MKVVGYHRPATVGEALGLLEAAGRLPLAGGTSVNADPSRAPVEVVDLQALPLKEVTRQGDRLECGALVTLAELAAHPTVPPVIATLVRREAPSTLRAMATLGGTVAVGDPESELLSALLVHEAEVTLVSITGKARLSLEAYLASPPPNTIISSVTFSLTGTTAVDRTGRTPADRPIVAAVARRTDDGRILLAVCGVAARPVLVDDPAALDPPGDFRGSPDYRRQLAAVLSARVLTEVHS